MAGGSRGALHQPVHAPRVPIAGQSKLAQLRRTPHGDTLARSHAPPAIDSAKGKSPNTEGSNGFALGDLTRASKFESAELLSHVHQGTTPPACCRELVKTRRGPCLLFPLRRFLPLQLLPNEIPADARHDPSVRHGRIQVCKDWDAIYLNVPYRSAHCPPLTYVAPPPVLDATSFVIVPLSLVVAIVPGSLLAFASSGRLPLPISKKSTLEALCYLDPPAPAGPSITEPSVENQTCPTRLTTPSFLLLPSRGPRL